MGQLYDDPGRFAMVSPKPRRRAVAATTCPNTLCRVRWRREPGFRLVAMKDVRRLTGLEPAEVLRRPGRQRPTRIDESGAREELLRVPIEVLIEEPEG